MIRKTGPVLALFTASMLLLLSGDRPAVAQTGNVNKAFASGTLTGSLTFDPLTLISIPDRTLFQVQVYTNSYGLVMGRLSYTDASFNMVSSGRVKLLAPITSTQARLLFIAAYKTSSDLLYVTLTKTTSLTGIVTNSVSFQCTDYYGNVYPGMTRSRTIDLGGTLLLTP